MPIISNSIKGSGVTAKIDTKGLIEKTPSGKHKIINGLTKDDSSTDSDDGTVAQDNGATGAQSTVNSKQQDAKTTVKNGTLVSPVDHSPNTNAPRGGPENYVRNNSTGFNGNPAEGYRGFPNLPNGAALAVLSGLAGGLGGLGSLFGGGQSSTPPGLSGGGSPGASSPRINSPQSSQPSQKPRDTTKEAEKFSDQARKPEAKKPEIEKPSKEEMYALNGTYGKSNNFLVSYGIKADKTPNIEGQNNFKANYDYANSGDPKHDQALAEKMDNFIKARDEATIKALEIGAKFDGKASIRDRFNNGINSKEFLVGTGNPSVSGLEPIRQAYDAINQHLEERGYKNSNGEQLKADDLLTDPKALERSKINTSPVTNPDDLMDTIPPPPDPQTSYKPTSSLDLAIYDHDQVPDMDFKDEQEEINFDELVASFDLDNDIEFS